MSVRPHDRPRLALRAGRRRCVLDPALVDAVGRLGPVRDVPGAPAEVLGLTEWRGRVVTVIDLATLVGERAAAPAWLVRLAAPYGHAALAVAEPPVLTVAGPDDAIDLGPGIAALCGGA